MIQGEEGLLVSHHLAFKSKYVHKLTPYKVLINTVKNTPVI